MKTALKRIPNVMFCNPPESDRSWNCHYFKVSFNHFRDVSGSTANKVTDKEDLRECEGVLALPANYTETGVPVPLVIFCHGAGGRVCEQENLSGGIGYASQCLKHGYAVMDVCGSEPHGLTKGCPEHTFALYKAYRYVTTHFNVRHQVLIGGGSMGGQTAMNFANTFPSLVLAIGLFFPRLNMDGTDVDGHYCIGTWDKMNIDSAGMTQHDRVAETFRFPTDEWCEANTIGFNPYRVRCFVNQQGKRAIIPPCPVKIWHGLADTVVDPVISREFVASVRRAGCYAELHELEGVGHRYNDVMMTELLYWFNRFA